MSSTASTDLEFNRYGEFSEEGSYLAGLGRQVWGVESSRRARMIPAMMNIAPRINNPTVSSVPETKTPAPITPVPMICRIAVCFTKTVHEE